MKVKSQDEKIDNQIFFEMQIFDLIRCINSVAIVFNHSLVLSISEQLDLGPVTAFAKVVIELPLSVSG